MRHFLRALPLVLGLAAPSLGRAAESPVEFQVTTKQSLLRIGVTPDDSTARGTEAARLVFSALETQGATSATKAIEMYKQLIPMENLGGDYTALQWFCEYFVAPPQQRAAFLSNPLDAAYFHYFADNNYDVLKEYLIRKYRLNVKSPDPATRKKREEYLSYKPSELTRRAFLQDFIMFNNPRRDQWEKTKEVMDLLDLKHGEKIIDIGCGFGYYTFRFSDLVGAEGRVYAVDIVSEMIDFVKKFAQDQGVTNIVPVVSKATDISVTDPADVVFVCSLYHVIYGKSTEQDRKPFLLSIKKALKPGGRLFIADNAPGENGLDLHSCFVSKDLLIAQLHFYGFRLEKYAQIAPYRYVLIFKQEEPGTPSPSAAPGDGKGYPVRVESGNSLVHIGSLDSFDVTTGGTLAASYMLEAFSNKDADAARKALDIYELITPKENFGGEYTALQWFCEYFVAPQEQKQAFLKDKLVEAYYDYLAKDDYALLKQYLSGKYKIRMPKAGEAPGPSVARPIGQPSGEKPADQAADEAPPVGAPPEEEEPVGLEKEDPAVGQTRRAFLEDFILFNNPKREEWEKTSKVMELLNFKKGDRVLDIGCGAGYFTYKFSPLVGAGGRIYAIDIKSEHLEFLDKFLKSQGITNVTTVLSKNDDICVREPTDVAFMCSLYHVVYGVLPEPERDGLLQSVKKSLKKGGTLIIVDNGPVEGANLPYHGPYIAKELATAQLQRYGFQFQEFHQIIPQRYLMKFTLQD